MMLVLGIYVLAVARVVRLVNADMILDPLRLAIARRARNMDASPAERKRWTTLFDFIGCPWCVSVWVAFGSAWVPLYQHDNPVARYVTLALAVSQVIGLLSRLDSDDEITVEEG